MDWVTTVGTTMVFGTAAYAGYLHMKNANAITSIFSKSDQSPKNQLIQVINEAKKSLDVAVFLFTENDLAASISDAAERGVRIRLVTDQNQVNYLPKQKANIESLYNSGIPVKVNRHSGSMHLKILIADTKVMTTGSYNFTTSAETKNDEVLVTIRSRKMAKEWTSQFEEMWHDETQFQAWTPSAYSKQA
ncbi:phospholipase D-like domain-containing protein [Halobacillus sp. Marseille-P3879]|uniref:phospholipase D-like domain-containing protein n=1 Tax=Halobacillus sp. Marseille-P3879 TaxID=2045014 RepID=UPI000C7B22BC|nr:phospholipase D-like domain-containing protein [Halobacillus sp. Marseille-P3879]